LTIPNHITGRATTSRCTKPLPQATPTGLGTVGRTRISKAHDKQHQSHVPPIAAFRNATRETKKHTARRSSKSRPFARYLSCRRHSIDRAQEALFLFLTLAAAGSRRRVMLEPLATTVLLNLLLLLIANPALISAKTPRVAQRFDGDTSSTLTMTGPALRRVRACVRACVWWSFLSLSLLCALRSADGDSRARAQKRSVSVDAQGFYDVVHACCCRPSTCLPA
jgi:hypothetical protein